MSIVSSPWKRVKTRVEIPDGVTANALLALDDVPFSELIRSNLYPLEGEQLRSRWERLWRVLRGNDDLAERTLDVLEAWQKTTRADLRAGLSDQEQARVQKFLASCEQAWDRVDVDTRQPLAWAGVKTAFSPAAQRVINQLVQAIDQHRDATNADDATDADHRLWQVLRRINLDPRDFNG